MNKEELIAFSEEIKDLFLAGEIHAPIHLSTGSEDALIEIFKEIRPQDWVFSTHRSHFHALLKGIPPEWVKAAILVGRSMHLNNREYKFVTSSIVGGCLPIAVGVAMAIKRKGLDEKVWVFIGDMASTTGMCHECLLYASGWELPITFVIENNSFSVNTPTSETWGNGAMVMPRVYSYERVYPHSGCGKFVTF